MKVLFGFKHEPTERAIRNYLESYGIEVDGKIRYTKKTIEDVIRKESDLDVVIVKEYLEGGEKYSAQEISALCDVSTARFIVIVNPSERGTDTMRTLYCAGVLDACYADRRHGAKPQLLASLAMKGRKRLEAREYYHIDDALPDYGALSFQEYEDSYAFLKGASGDGGRMIDHFIDLSKMLSPRQFAKFIDTLSENDLAGLLPYVEFYEILDALQRSGIIVPHFKRPKDAQKALDEKTVKKAKAGKKESKFKKESAVHINAVHTDVRDIKEVEAHYGDKEQKAAANSRPVKRQGAPGPRPTGQVPQRGPQRGGASPEQRAIRREGQVNAPAQGRSIDRGPAMRPGAARPAGPRQGQQGARPATGKPAANNNSRMTAGAPERLNAQGQPAPNRRPVPKRPVRQNISRAERHCAFAEAYVRTYENTTGLKDKRPRRMRCLAEDGGSLRSAKLAQRQQERKKAK